MKTPFQLKAHQLEVLFDLTSLLESEIDQSQSMTSKTNSRRYSRLRRLNTVLMRNNSVEVVMYGKEKRVPLPPFFGVSVGIPMEMR